MSPRLLRVALGLFAVLVAVIVVLPRFRQAGAAPIPDETVPETTRIQREIIDWALELPSDPELAPLYQQMNARHFDGDLPPMTVRWEPRLTRVDNVPGETGLLKGMFGAVGDRTVIVLSPTLKTDPNAVRAALAHEMVHAYMHQMGADTSDHGPAFQAVLRRIAGEGAFDGPVSSGETLDQLKQWIADESARLRAEDAALNESPSSDRRERLLADRAKLTQEIQRYNEMLKYPTGR